jgi:hypothetical protein
MVDDTALRASPERPDRFFLQAGEAGVRAASSVLASPRRPPSPRDGMGDMFSTAE